MKNKKEKNKYFFMFLRYFFLLAIAIPNLKLLYIIFTPLTIFPVRFLLSLVYEIDYVTYTTFFVGNKLISLVPACIAVAGYYFLLILNFTTPMKLKTRIKSIIFLLLSFLILNILRIVSFTTLAINNSQLFTVTHMATWYLGSTLLVVILWFLNTLMFKINKIPVYTDAKELIKKIRGL